MKTNCLKCTFQSWLRYYKIFTFHRAAKKHLYVSSPTLLLWTFHLYSRTFYALISSVWMPLHSHRSRWIVAGNSGRAVLLCMHKSPFASWKVLHNQKCSEPCWLGDQDKYKDCIISFTHCHIQTNSVYNLVQIKYSDSCAHLFLFRRIRWTLTVMDLVVCFIVCLVWFLSPKISHNFSESNCCDYCTQFIQSSPYSVTYCVCFKKFW